MKKVGWGNKGIGADESEPKPKKAKKLKVQKKTKKPAEVTVTKAVNNADVKVGGEVIIDVEPKAGKDIGDPQITLFESSCPVCHAPGDCDCTESDRAFVVRTRFQAKIEGVGRCPCGAPLSVVYLKRPGVTSNKNELSHYNAAYGCVSCNGVTMASICLGENGRK